MYPHHRDRAKMMAVAAKASAQLAEQMAMERQEHTGARSQAQVSPRVWRVETLERRQIYQRPWIQIKIGSSYS